MRRAECRVRAHGCFCMLLLEGVTSLLTPRASPGIGGRFDLALNARGLQQVVAPCTRFSRIFTHFIAMMLLSPCLDHFGPPRRCYRCHCHRRCRPCCSLSCVTTLCTASPPPAVLTVCAYFLTTGPQAEALAEAMEGLPLHIVASSHLQRACCTADAVHRRHPEVPLHWPPHQHSPVSVPVTSDEEWQMMETSAVSFQVFSALC